MDLNLDLSGGHDPKDEAFLTAPPAEADLREAANMWIWDHQGRVGFPRVAVEAIGRHWSDRAVQLNIGFPDGRVLLGTQAAQAHPDQTDRFGAGPLAFQCLEPFSRWRADFDGEARWTTVKAQLAGEPPAGPSLRVKLSVDAQMAMAPYLRGAMDRSSADIIKRQADGVLVGRGYNYKHLFRCLARFEADGEVIDFTGGGLRVRRRGFRDSSDLRGHCWQSALFPSGRAFGYTCFPPRGDGEPSYDEGFVHIDGRTLATRTIKAPWLTRFDAPQDDLSVVLETSEGRIEIEGRDSCSTFVRRVSDLNTMFDMPFMGGADRLGFQQGIARYTWDGETAYGMIERSYPFAEMTRT